MTRFTVCLSVLLIGSSAMAQTTTSTPTETALPPKVETPPPTPPEATPPEATPPEATKPTRTIPQGGYFDVDPVIATAIIVPTMTFAFVSEGLIRTKEIQPQEPSAEANLLPIDSWVIEGNEINESAADWSNVNLSILAGYAVVDSTLQFFMDRGDSGWEYFALYLQSAGLSWSIGNIVKMAVRRPRPEAYLELRNTGVITGNTGDALSFFSGHSVMAATLGSTAIYIAWARESPPLEKWLVTGLGVLLPVLVAVDRIGARAHFPTDVITGLAVGGAIGTLVPHLQRNTGLAVGAMPVQGEGGGVALSGKF